VLSVGTNSSPAFVRLQCCPASPLGLELSVDKRVLIHAWGCSWAQRASSRTRDGALVTMSRPGWRVPPLWLDEVAPFAEQWLSDKCLSCYSRTSALAARRSDRNDRPASRFEGWGMMRTQSCREGSRRVRTGLDANLARARVMASSRQFGWCGVTDGARSRSNSIR
jgi:hypothetical protein